MENFRVILKLSNYHVINASIIKGNYTFFIGDTNNDFKNHGSIEEKKFKKYMAEYDDPMIIVTVVWRVYTAWADGKL